MSFVGRVSHAVHTSSRRNTEAACALMLPVLIENQNVAKWMCLCADIGLTLLCAAAVAAAACVPLQVLPASSVMWLTAAASCATCSMQ